MNLPQATSAEPKEYILIFEFDVARGDRMSGDLLCALMRDRPARHVTHWKGPFSHAGAGGTSPGRLLNLVWLSFRSCFGLLFGPKHRVVIVRSTPPLLHFPVALLCRWRGLRCIFWLMDYHPVIEQRLWAQHRWLAPLLRFLDRWDKRELAGFDKVVVLDQAMADLVATRNPAARVVVHPTWGSKLAPTALAATTLTSSTSLASSPRPVGALEAPGPITFAYLGNFGQGHGWATLAACIRKTARLRPACLLSIGLPTAAEPAFAALAAEIGADWEKHPRMTFDRAAALLRERRVAWGCVAMKTELAGCLSPSKFSGYLAAGVPLLYIGPVKSNAWRVCDEFGGGVALPENAQAEDIARAAELLASNSAQAEAASAASRACEHFDAFNGETLAAIILDAS